MNRIDELMAILSDARDNYYNQQPSMTDVEFDALEDELRELAPDCQYFSEIGAKPTGAWPKVKHEIPMGSLNKVQDEIQWVEWSEGWLRLKLEELSGKKFPILAVTEKYDGISIALKYVNGVFTQALTRGDGAVGEDITPNVSKMKNLVKKLANVKFNGWIRAEIVLLKSDWNAYFPDAKNPRNCASGTAKRQDGAGCEHLTVKPYEVIWPKQPFFSLTEQFNFLDNNGFQTDMCMSVVDFSEVPKLVKVWNDNRSEMDYEIDGLVVRANFQAQFEALGVVASKPKGAIAYKFPPEMKTTKVLEITWQYGLTGRITPVAEVEPVNIGGVTISRVSLHTAAIAEKSFAGPGATVLISRRNDVIPYIEKVMPTSVVSAIKAPNECPICKSWLVFEGEYLQCVDPSCSGQAFGNLKAWLNRLNVLHWGDSLIHKTIEYGFASSIQDLYTINWDKFAVRMGEGIAERARQSLDKNAKEMDLATFISALNIRHCQTTAKDLVNGGLDTIDKLMSASMQDLCNISGVGEVKAKSIHSGLHSLNGVIREVLKHVTIKSKEKVQGKLLGLSFCFTGEANRPRKELQAMVTNNGGEVKSSVTKGTTYLVVADPTSTSSKAEKARKLGTKLISEDEFVNMVNNG